MYEIHVLVQLVTRIDSKTLEAKNAYNNEKIISVLKIIHYIIIVF